IKESRSTSSSSSETSSGSSTPDVRASSESTSSSTVKCIGEDQTSLPLPYLKSLIQEKNGPIDLLHDPRTGTLEVTAADMIGNCSSMLEWKLKKPEIKARRPMPSKSRLEKVITAQMMAA